MKDLKAPPDASESDLHRFPYLFLNQSVKIDNVLPRSARAFRILPYDLCCLPFCCLNGSAVYLDLYFASRVILKKHIQQHRQHDLGSKQLPYDPQPQKIPDWWRVLMRRHLCCVKYIPNIWKQSFKCFKLSEKYKWSILYESVSLASLHNYDTLRLGNLNCFIPTMFKIQLGRFILNILKNVQVIGNFLRSYAKESKNQKIAEYFLNLNEFYFKSGKVSYKQSK